MPNDAGLILPRGWRWLLPSLLGLIGLAPAFPGRLEESLAHQSYDWLHQLSGLQAAALKEAPVVIVYLDRDSHRQLGLSESRPWPRDLHARLLDHLTAAGARAVVMDVIFSGAGQDPAADRELAEALRRNGRVVLGEAINSSTSDAGGAELRPRTFRLESPYPMFATNTAATGLTSISPDDDLVCRRLFSGFPSLASQSLAYAAAGMLGGAPPPSPGQGDRWVRYYGPPFALPHASYYRALNPGEIPDDFFRNRVVLVGAQPLPGQFNTRSDEWRSPFVDLDEPDRFMPGVEVHATQLMNLMRGDWLRRPGPLAEALAWVAFGVLIAGFMIRLPPAWGVPLVLLAGGVMVLAAVVTLNTTNVWFAWTIPVLVQAPAAIAGGLTLHTVDWFIARRRAGRRIREQAELINQARDAIRLFNLEGRLQLANPRARALFGGNGEGNAAMDFTAEPAAEARRLVLHSGQWQGEITADRGSSRERVLASRWTLIRDERGRPTGILVIDTDITEQKRLETQLLQAQRLEAVGSIAGGMAHDLNNSLAPLLMGVQMLKQQHADEATLRTLDHMESSARRGAEMVRQVLSFARGKGSDLESLDLGVLIREMVRLARETFPRNIRVEQSIASDLWPVTGNPTQLHQVLLNLCVNARDAMPEGGTLTLIADNATLQEGEIDTIAGAQPGEFVSLMINDTGTGIPAEHLPRLFQTFFTTKPEGQGTGLGLPTVKRIVESHHGFMRVESTPGAGTTFELFLPRALRSSVPSKTLIDGTLPPGTGQHILLVDDTGAIRELLADSLTSHGYEVRSTGAPSEALDWVSAGGWIPDLLILDLNLPGIQGLDLLAAIRRPCAGIPAVLISSGDPPAAADIPSRSRFLAKPVDLEELRRQIHCLLLENKE